METIREVLIRRDRLTSAEIDEMLEEAKDRIFGGDDPEEVLAEEFGLEPDYLMDEELGVF